MTEDEKVACLRLSNEFMAKVRVQPRTACLQFRFLITALYLLCSIFYLQLLFWYIHHMEKTSLSSLYYDNQDFPVTNQWTEGIRSCKL